MKLKKLARKHKAVLTLGHTLLVIANQTCLGVSDKVAPPSTNRSQPINRCCNLVTQTPN